MAQGESEFGTLSGEDSERRANLHRKLADRQDSAFIGFLAEVDRQLKLLWEARAGFEHVLKANSDEAYKTALDEVNSAIQTAGPF